MENRTRPSALVRKVLGPILEGKREPQPLFATKEASRKYMNDAITKRRNDFIAEYSQGFHGSSVLTYEPALDREVYKELNHIHRENLRQIENLGIANVHHQKEQLLETNTQAHQDVLNILNSYTKFQVETFIGERLNVGLSKFAYDIRYKQQADGNQKGVLYGQNMSETLLEMIARGRDTRNTVVNPVDIPRQEAEVKLFQQIQDIMGDPKTEVGSTILSFSPPGKKGSAYAHNFYDVFILREKEGNNGEKIRYVEARRYASGLSGDESLQKADQFQPEYRLARKQDEPLDAFLIRNPIVLGSWSEFFANPDGLHQSLQGDKNAMSYEDFQEKVLKDKLFSEMLQYYLGTLEHNPTDKKLLNQTLDAIMNRADEIVELRGAIVAKVSRWRRHTSIGPISIEEHVKTYSKEKVRPTSTGCGSSGGLGEERRAVNMSPTRTSEVASGEDKYGKQTFECPTCHKTNIRPYNELLSECQHCHSTKVAC